MYISKKYIEVTAYYVKTIIIVHNNFLSNTLHIFCHERNDSIMQNFYKTYITEKWNMFWNEKNLHSFSCWNLTVTQLAWRGNLSQHKIYLIYGFDVNVKKEAQLLFANARINLQPCTIFCVIKMNIHKTCDNAINLMKEFNKEIFI